MRTRSPARTPAWSLATSTSEYSMSGPTATAEFDGSVQGVVVQMRASSGRAESSRSFVSRRRPTVTVLSVRSWYTSSSILSSWLLSGVRSFQQ